VVAKSFVWVYEERALRLIGEDEEIGGAVAENLTGRVDILLDGGPESLSLSDRKRRVSAGESKVKILRGNCTEHFCQTAETTYVDQCEFQIYRWSHRTYVAE
jgi:hypothetical protein